MIKETITRKTVIRDDQAKKDGTVRLDFLVYFKRKNYRVSSGISINPKDWVQKEECVDKKCDYASDVNKELQHRLSDFDSYIRQKMIFKEEVHLGDLKLILKGKQEEINKIASKAKMFPLLSEAIDNYLNYRELSESSEMVYESFKNVLFDYYRAKGIKELTIEKVDFKFLEQFKKYLREERKIPNKQGSISKQFKLLKTVIRYSIKSGYKIENPFVNYKIEQGKSKETVLAKDEYQRLRKIKISKTDCASLKLSQDIFVFCCETGLRYSDVMDLSWNHIDWNDKMLGKIQVKTNLNVDVPLQPRAICILISYRNSYKDSHGYVFPRIKNNVLNKYLKKLSVLAKINKNITSHVARHTYGTHLGTSGVISAFELRDLMGHSDVSMSQRYVNISKNDLKNAMQRFRKSGKKAG